jgi:Pyruvate/2-oxoacid:ferredoxin oxidoreductase delta subunit
MQSSLENPCVETAQCEQRLCPVRTVDPRSAPVPQASAEDAVTASALPRSKADPNGSWRLLHPVINREVCSGCSLCAVVCPDAAIRLDADGYPIIDLEHCKGRRLLTGNAAAAWGARLADVEYIPAFPITPQTEIIEDLAAWCADGSLPARFVTLDGEHSMLTAAGAAAATGCRVFTATSSQGLLFGLEALWTVAGWRVPFVLVNVSRALATPITLEPDHNDILAARDSGCVQIHAATCQEVLDSVLLAYRIAEDPRVLLPVIVNLDGFYLSFTREPVELPGLEDVRRFLPPPSPRAASFWASRPSATDWKDGPLERVSARKSWNTPNGNDRILAGAVEQRA